MYNLLISAAVAVVAFLLVTLTAGFHYWWAGLIAALLLFMGSFLLIARIVTKKLEAIMAVIQPRTIPIIPPKKVRMTASARNCKLI